MGSAWLIFSMFGGPSLSLILEETAVERPVQLARLVATFGLDVVDDQESVENAVCWSEYCRFELVVFSVSVAVEGEATADGAAPPRLERPFTFRHRERPNAPGTLLKEAAETNMRAWDFTTGEAYLSHPTPTPKPNPKPNPNPNPTPNPNPNPNPNPSPKP